MKVILPLVGALALVGIGGVLSISGSSKPVGDKELTGLIAAQGVGDYYVDNVKQCFDAAHEARNQAALSNYDKQLMVKRCKCVVDQAYDKELNTPELVLTFAFAGLRAQNLSGSRTTKREFILSHMDIAVSQNKNIELMQLTTSIMKGCMASS